MSTPSPLSAGHAISDQSIWPPGFAPGVFPSTIRQLLPVPDHWPPEMLHGASRPRPAAVLMLFLLPEVESGERAQILMIKRSATLRSHRGQVGFPGGRAEPDERSPSACVLRECQEEVGLNPAAVQLLGALPPVAALDGSPVLPIVGITTTAQVDLQPSADEVAEMFSVPWDQLSLPKMQIFTFKVFGQARTSPLFPVNPYPVWGLTAKILESVAMEP